MLAANLIRDRVQEIDTYLDLLGSIDNLLKSGTALAEGVVITPLQQRILYACVYLQIYNLIEATITKCIEDLANALVNGSHEPHHLTESLLKEWVVYVAQTNKDLNPENRLNRALILCNHLAHKQPVLELQISQGGGGNWTDTEVEKLIRRLGFSLQVPPNVRTATKRTYRNDQAALMFIKCLRNDLAHGNLSFAECGASDTVSDLINLRTITVNYLNVIVNNFETAIRNREYLEASRR